MVPIDTLDPLLSVKEAAPPAPVDKGTPALSSPKETKEYPPFNSTLSFNLKEAPINVDEEPLKGASAFASPPVSVDWPLVVPANTFNWSLTFKATPSV